MSVWISMVGFSVVLMGMVMLEDASSFKITSKRADDRVDVISKDRKICFVIRSPSGISHTTIERTAKQWPDQVMIQLKLAGLENFKLSTDRMKLEASVSSNLGEVRYWKQGEEDSPLDSTSAYWMAVKVLDSDGVPTKVLPLKDGCFEMQLPRKLFESNPKSFKLEWIDFYRS
jgi:hypothetical protein